MIDINVSAYDDGVTAQTKCPSPTRRVPPDANPYRRGTKDSQSGLRVAWYNGWLDTWLLRRFPDLFGPHKAQAAGGE